MFFTCPLVRDLFLSDDAMPKTKPEELHCQVIDDELRAPPIHDPQTASRVHM
jgi:hypothetical protein